MADRSRQLAALLVLFGIGSIAGCATATPSERSSGAPPPAVATDPSRRALLVGIKDYRDVGDLIGCVNDVNAMRAVLIRRFGFPESNIRVLTDADATRQNVIAAIEQLVADTQVGDAVVLHYSGHGSQAPDPSGDEADEADETIVPHDGRTANVPDITDDEIGALLAPLQEKTQNVVVILDCCHSGTATKSLRLLTRHIEPDTREHLYRRDTVTTKSVHDVAGFGHVLIAGAAADQQALDGPIEAEGRYHGALTYALLSVLDDSDPRRPVRDLFGDLEEEYRKLGVAWNRKEMPEPQLEGDTELLNRPFLPTAPAETRRAWVPVKMIGSEGLYLTDTNAHGIAKGAVWAVFARDETRFQPTDSLALAIVDSVEGTRAKLVVTQRRGPIEDAGRAVLVLQPPPSTRIAVCVEGVDRQQVEAVLGELQRRIPTLASVGRDEFAHLLVAIGDSDCRVLGADMVSEMSTVQLGAGLEGALERIIRSSILSRELMQLGGGDAEIALTVGVTQKAPPRMKSFEVVADHRVPVYTQRAAGEQRNEQNSLQLEVHADRDCYLTVVAVNTQGEIGVLFPNVNSERNAFLPGGRLEGGEKVRIPDSLENGNRAGFFWDVTPPFGQDTIRVFASVDEASAVALRGAFTQLRAGSGPQAIDAVWQQTRKEIGKGWETVPDRPSNAGWVSRSLTVTTREEAP